MNRKIVSALISVVFLALFLFGCGSPYVSPKATADEILLQIKLDVKEDVGLLVIDYDANGSGGSGGTSNADKSLLKHDETIFHTLDRAFFDDPSDVMSLSLQFTIITEYVDPNYENIYPAEYTKQMNALLVDASFGETYCITITGDKTNGYTAVLEDR